MRYISIRQQLIEERRKNAALRAQTKQNSADIDYIAMVADIDLENDEDNKEVSDND